MLAFFLLRIRHRAQREHRGSSDVAAALLRTDLIIHLETLVIFEPSILMAPDCDSPARTTAAKLHEFSIHARLGAAQFVGNQFENRLRYRVHSQLHEDSGRRDFRRVAGAPTASTVDPWPLPPSATPARTSERLARGHSSSSAVHRFRLKYQQSPPQEECLRSFRSRPCPRKRCPRGSHLPRTRQPKKGSRTRPPESVSRNAHAEELAFRWSSSGRRPGHQRQPACIPTESFPGRSPESTHHVARRRVPRWLCPPFQQPLTRPQS